MKRLASLVLLFGLCLSVLVGCGNEKDVAAENGVQSGSTTATEVAIGNATSNPEADGSGAEAPDGSPDGKAQDGSAPPAPGKPSAPSATRPTTPVQEGDAVPTLQAPPEKSLALVNLPTGFKEASFQVEASPYGWAPAPEDATRQQLLVKVTSAKTLDEGAKSLPKIEAGMNLVLVMEGELADRTLVKSGGNYSITIAVRPQGDVGALFVEKISALK